MDTILDRYQYNNNNNNNAVEALGEAVDSNFIITSHLVEELGNVDHEAEWNRLAEEYYEEQYNEEREYYACLGPNWIEEEEDFNQEREEEWERREQERIEMENIRQLRNQLRLTSIQETEITLLLFTEEDPDRRIYLENDLQNLRINWFQLNRTLNIMLDY